MYGQNQFNMNMYTNMNFGNYQNNNYNISNQFYLKFCLMRDLFNQIMFQQIHGIEQDPYEIQKTIVRGLSDFQPKVIGGNPIHDAFIKSSKYIESDYPGPDKVNLVFVMMQGNKHTRTFKKNDKIRYVLEEFIKSIGLGVKVLNKIYFLYNATNLNNLGNTKTLEEFKIYHNARINVIDSENIIGA